MTIAGFFEQFSIQFAGIAAPLVIAVELAGGLAMIAGLGTRIVGALFAATMAVAFATVRGAQGFFPPNGDEYVLVLFAASVARAVQGAAAFAIDNILANRRVDTPAHGGAGLRWARLWNG